MSWRAVQEQPLEEYLTGPERADIARSAAIEGFVLRSDLGLGHRDAEHVQKAKLRREGRAKRVVVPSKDADGYFRGAHLGACAADPVFHLIDEGYESSIAGGATICGRWVDNGDRWCWCGIGKWEGRICGTCAAKVPE